MIIYRMVIVEGIGIVPIGQIQWFGLVKYFFYHPIYMIIDSN